ncbi:MAG: alpha/beta hydrolase [Alphaproteobacteria bacterium]|nr:alpha/beta hydrolase [Alphaproteobacteria bacterium]
MARDPRIDTVISLFRPRMISSGVPLADFEDAISGLERWEDWCPRFAARGAFHEGLAREALAAGHALSAAGHFDTAAILYHFGKFMFGDYPEAMRATHEKAVACRTAALPHLNPPGERVEIPFEGTTLKANLRKPKGVSNPPVVIMVPGLEATKEELLSYEPWFLERGMATLPVDGPGQGEAEYDIPMRGEWETVAGPICDWIESRPDLDGGRIGIWGVSMGGYYAPRAVCFETRIKACVAISGAYEWGENWDQKSDINRNTFRIRSHKATLEEAREHAKSFTLRGVAKGIACPLFLVAGKLDRLLIYDAAQRVAEEVSGPVEVVVVEDGNHVCHNRPYRTRPATTDWMAARLGAAPAG